MFNISREFAPPFSLISPFFVVGVLFYFVASFALFAFDVNVDYFDLSLIGWVHLFLLGFVMMIIFGSSAQLIPVVLETGHFSVDFYYLILPLLTIGTILMSIGFFIAPNVLPYGGLIVLVAMLIFLYETIMTLKKVKYSSLTIKTIKSSNIFLLFGVIVGFMMVLGVGAGVDIDLNRWVDLHIAFVLVGFVALTIMGISLTLLPMFGLAHGFDDEPIHLGFNIAVASMTIFLLSALFEISFLEILSLELIFLSFGFYLYQVWLIYQTRARKEYDIWFNSMLFGYISLAVSVLLAFFGFFYLSKSLILSSFWFFIMGFVSFLIIGHLYKIVPFLVWFERFSPLVGKERVPMLADMTPKKEAKYQFWFSVIGVVVAGAGLFFEDSTIFKGGVTFVVIGAIFLVCNLFWMKNFKRID